MSRDLCTALTRTRNPALSVSSFWFDELQSTLLTWLPSQPDDESPLLGRIPTPCLSLSPPYPCPRCVVGYFPVEFLLHRTLYEALISLYMCLVPPPDCLRAREGLTHLQNRSLQPTAGLSTWVQCLYSQARTTPWSKPVIQYFLKWYRASNRINSTLVQL